MRLYTRPAQGAQNCSPVKNTRVEPRARCTKIVPLICLFADRCVVGWKLFEECGPSFCNNKIPMSNSGNVLKRRSLQKCQFSAVSNLGQLCTNAAGSLLVRVRHSAYR